MPNNNTDDNNDGMHDAWNKFLFIYLRVYGGVSELVLKRWQENTFARSQQARERYKHS